MIKYYYSWILSYRKLKQYLKQEENLGNSIITEMTSYITAINTIKLIGDDFKKSYNEDN